MPEILNQELLEAIDKASSTITLYRHGSMRSGQKLPVSRAAMDRAIREVKVMLYRNTFHASLADLEHARSQFVSSIEANIHATSVVLNEADKAYLASQVLAINQVHLAAAAKPIPIRTRTQPGRAAKKPKF